MRRITVLRAHAEDAQDGDALVASTMFFSLSTDMDILAAATFGAYTGIFATIVALPVPDPVALTETEEVVRSILMRLAPSELVKWTRESVDMSRLEPSSNVTVIVTLETVRARDGNASARGSVFA